MWENNTNTSLYLRTKAIKSVVIDLIFRRPIRLSNNKKRNKTKLLTNVGRIVNKSLSTNVAWVTNNKFNNWVKPASLLGMASFNLLFSLMSLSILGKKREREYSMRPLSCFARKTPFMSYFSNFSWCFYFFFHLTSLLIGILRDYVVLTQRHDLVGW